MPADPTPTRWTRAVEEIRKRRDLAVAVRVLRTERDEAPYYQGQEDAYSAALDLLVDGGGDGDTGHAADLDDDEMRAVVEMQVQTEAWRDGGTMADDHDAPFAPLEITPELEAAVYCTELEAAARDLLDALVGQQANRMTEAKRLRWLIANRRLQDDDEDGDTDG
jgi:hypothetical protein